MKNNRLLIGTTGTVTPFLGEGDLPDHARLNKTPNDEDTDLAEALSKSAQDAGMFSLPWHTFSLISPTLKSHTMMQIYVN